MEKFDLLIYDFDGTLYDTRPGLQRILQQMLTKFGFDAQAYDLRAFVGPPMEWSLANIVGAPQEIIPEMIGYFRPLYHQSALENLVFFEGILPMLDDFKQQGIKQAIASLKFLPSLTEIIAKAELQSYFEVIAGYLPDQPKTKAQLIKDVMQQTQAKSPLMIGDRHFDMDGAEEAGIPFIGVGYGYAHDEQELAAGDYWVATVQELHHFLQERT